MSRKLRSSLPSIANPVPDLSEQDDHQLEGGKKRRLMSKVAACNACRKRKSRCDGVRPCCGACNQQTRKCIYDVEPGISRHKSIRHRLDVLETKHKFLQDVVHKIRDGTPEQVDLLLRRLKAGDVDGIEPMGITPMRMPDSPPDSLIVPDQDEERCVCLGSDTGEQHPLVDDTSHGCCSILPPRHVFDTAVAGYLDSVDVLFHAYTAEQARHLLDIVFSSDQLVQPVQPSSALTQLCSIAAVGSLCVLRTASIQTTKSFYNFAQYFLNSLVEENTLKAAKVVLMLAYCDIMTKTTMALNHINLGLALSEKYNLKSSQESTSASSPEWLDRRRLWTTLIILKGWIFSTTDLPVETDWLACHQMLRNFQFTTDMHWRDAIQLEMAKITTIKADVRSTLHNTKNFQPQIFAEARYQLQGWCRDLPESMCLHSLLDNDLLATEDRIRTLFTHLTYLSGLMLLPQYLAREWIKKIFSTADLSSVEAVRGLNAGFSAAEQSARMLSLLRPQQDIIMKRWFCTSISYTSSTMLLFTLSQQLLRSSPHIQNKTTFKPAWESLKCLQLCASKDHAAKVLYSRLQPHIAVIQAERLRISTLPRQLPVGDGHLFAIPSGDSALYHTAHALLDLVAQPFPIISGDGIYSVMDE